MGDALLGVLDPKILENGIPDEAYAVLSGDDKAVAAALKKQNKADLKSWKAIAANDLFAASPLTAEANAVEHLADDTLDGIAAKRSAWAQATTHARHSTVARLADTYVAAFLAPKVAAAQQSIPLSGYLWALLRGQGAVDAIVDSAADHICRTHGVFHWWLAFPQVAAKGGFAVMLGNPPWERIKLQEEEFFASRSPLVAVAKNKSERGKRIELLRQGLLLHTLYPDVEVAEGLSPPNRAEMQLYLEFLMARRGAEAASLYAHDSGRYPTTGVGDVNTYALFVETFSQLVSAEGRAGFIVPTGIATDDSTKAYFELVSQSNRLAAFYSFENEEFIFRAVHHAMKFCLMVIGGVRSNVGPAQFVHSARQVENLYESDRRFTLTPDEFRLINPNTRTCPVFRSQRDAELTKKLYRNAPVLLADVQPDDGGNPNPWGIRFSTMFHMSNDSVLFHDGPAGPDSSRRLPLYEAKMIHQFDHRWATYVDAPDRPDGLDTKDVSDAQRSDPAFTVRPRYWVDETEVLARIARVPSRVANAWLACCKANAAARSEQGAGLETVATSQALTDTREAFTLALAGWVAGALFLRAVVTQGGDAAKPSQIHVQTASLFNDPTPVPALATSSVIPAAPPWTDKAAVAATQAAELQLAVHYGALWESLKQANITGKKALSAFTKWALQDDPALGLGLNDSEMDELRAPQPPHRVDGLIVHPEAPHPSSTRSGDQFGIHFYWLDAQMNRRSPRWLMGFRGITNATNERSFISALIPRVAAGNSCPILIAHWSANLIAALCGNLASLVLDFVARQKIGGTNLNFFIVKQFPVIAPDSYTEADLFYIVPRVLELTHNANDMQPWADDLVAYDPRPADQRQTPFHWSPDRRAMLRAELDAYYARLYGLTRDELRYILDPADVMGADYPSETFRVLKKNEEREFLEYRTQRLVLAAWDQLAIAAN